MRHQSNKVTLDRKTASRSALLANLAESVVLYEKVTTTKAKAKAVRPVVERLITRSKNGTLATRRALITKLYTKNAVDKLINELGPRYKERAGGYTRITLLNNRKGDGAEEAVIELV